jgi:uncharacterized protein YndB with AHSA1/START domain
MKFEIELEKTYPQPIDKVWRALTDREALGSWLMKTDFAPEAGRAFQMWCEDGEGGTERYLCEVLELEPPRRMVWSWTVESRQGEDRTRVEFRLEERPGGTRLTIRHTGDRDTETVERYRGGWPGKLGQLADVLRSDTGTDRGP